VVLVWNVIAVNLYTVSCWWHVEVILVARYLNLDHCIQGVMFISVLFFCQ
jgi:hypothetical protein